MKNTLIEIKNYIRKNSIAEYRYKQILNAIFKQKISDFEAMIGLPQNLRQDLKKNFGKILKLKELETQKSNKTKKVLFQLKDKQRIESVLMQYKNWNTLCISTQVGCKMGCTFCATGNMGFKRNLSVNEMIGQPLYFLLNDYSLHSISLMGMGEPLENPNIFSCLHLLEDKNMFNFGERNINVSTIGIIPGIERLSKEFPQINIALSLHTALSGQRKELIPASRKYPLEKVMQTLDKHIRKNNRKVFLAYLMLENINDTNEHLNRLESIIKARTDIAYLYHVNLIEYNPGKGCPKKFKPSGKEKIREFRSKLENKGINVSIRKSFGQNIEAGCGQLHANY